ncbi:MAG TPA: glycerol-3-phosphate dehydrogenase [Pyrinomonadaceae bacterium]|jgi:glycerol-3-phosphate dehydrogenase|nr:glycerol-3-phosphate dehydrogenase [Pyrinomonadaceae bacterium]
MVRSAATDIEEASLDLIVVGAGINGAGVARDAAMRGLRVLLLDKGDIASGTTSWSTRLIHGGLRYLEHGEVSLVRESLRERERLFHIAPHLVRPLPMIIPVYEGQRRGPLMIRAGMIAYDLLSLDKSLDRHRMLSREETLRRVPGLRAEGLRGAALYYDAQVEYAERLVLENVLSAREHGARVHTYARVSRFIIEDGAVRGVEFTDLLGGGSRQRALSLLTLNVSGPWVDLLLGTLEHPPSRLLGGTKGSHIVVDDFPGAPRDALYVEAHEDGRPFFIIRWNGMYLIGTTDSRYDDDPDAVAADEREIAYLLRETNRVIPSARLTRRSVLYTYSGVRPLAYDERSVGGSITRRHFVHDHADRLEGFLSIVGGKLTTYRNLSEEAVDLVFKKLGRETPPCETAKLRLPGAQTDDFAAFGQRFKSDSGLNLSVAERLLRVYGTRAPDLLRLAAEGPDLLEVLSPLTGAIGAEILMSFRHELARTLADCLLRRTMLGLNGAVGLDAVEGAARIARKYLGWSIARAEDEVAAYRRYIERFHPRSLSAT